MKLTTTIAALLIAATPAVAGWGEPQDTDGCGGCEGPQHDGPAPVEPDPTPDPQESGDFIRPDEAGNWITGPIDWRCRNEPVCEGGRR